jgi:hypothetical protein
MEFMEKESDIIENDEDTKEEDGYSKGYPFQDSLKKEVNLREDKVSIFEWLRKLKNDHIILNPEFQRHIVWDIKQKSEFIESILLNIPIPPIYVNQNKEGKYVVIDGLQRTSTLDEFINKKSFKLKHLEILTDINDKFFTDLSPLFKAKIEDKQLYIYIIKPSVQMTMVTEIYKRINTAGTQLTRQEIRHCLYMGKATKLLGKLSKKEYFKRAIDYGISPKRMKDREAILRYLAFKIFDYEKYYNNDMDDFLINAIKKINDMEPDQINKLEQDFKRTMDLTYEFFGKNNFRMLTDSNRRSRINIAIMESIGHFFSNKSDDFLNSNKQKIELNYRRLLLTLSYIEAVRSATNDRKKVLARFQLAYDILGDV